MAKKRSTKSQNAHSYSIHAIDYDDRSLLDSEAEPSVADHQRFCILCHTYIDPSRRPKIALAFENDVCLSHCGPAGHPEAPERLHSVLQMIKKRHFCCSFHTTPSREATIEEVYLCHTQSHWRHILSLTNSVEDKDHSTVHHEDYLSFGGDNYYSSTTAKAALTSLGTALNLVDEVMDPSNPVQIGFAAIRPPGHHACSSKAMGFCYLNNVAIAAKKLRKKGAKVLVVDFDVHHGNGTQELLSRDPHFLYFSIHRYDKGKFYPSTGNQKDIGLAAGKGYSINIPLQKGYGDADVYISFRDILFPSAFAFKPDCILVSAGFDAMNGDPLGCCCLSPAMFGWMTRQLIRLSKLLTQNRIVFVLEGGYDPKLLTIGVEECLNNIIKIDKDQEIEKMGQFVERYREIEYLATPNYGCQVTTSTPSATPFNKDISWIENLDSRFDLLSQIVCLGRGRGYTTQEEWNNLCVPLPFVVCPKTTWKIINEVYQIHSLNGIIPSRPLPLVCRTKKRERFFTCDVVPNSITLWSDAPTRSSSWQELLSTDDNERVPQKSILSFVHVESDKKDTFETVGGHAHQWTISNKKNLGYICKATGPIEAVFYKWIALSSGIQDKPSLHLCRHHSQADPENKEMFNGPGCFFEILPFPSTNLEASRQLMGFIPECLSIEIPIGYFDPATTGLKFQPFGVEMKNLISNFAKPCLMDIKFGTRMYGDEATKEKKKKMIEKAKNTTSEAYGVRCTGARMWNFDTGEQTEITRCEASNFKSLDHFEKALHRYLDAVTVAQRKAVAERFKKKILELCEFFQNQTIANFYSSSVLFMYDNSVENNVMKSVDIKMIDFAHVTFNAGQIDEGYLKGLNCLLQLFDLYLLQCDTYSQADRS